MAVTAFVYPKILAAAFNKEIDILDDDIRAGLFVVGYSYSKDNDDYYNDTVAGTNEVSGTGYTANGQSLANDTLSYNSGTDTYTYDSDDPSWTTATITARLLVLYDRTPATDATRPLIVLEDFGANVTSTAGTFLFTVAATGWMTWAF